jgi:tetratricopeptide (TPR) repeat protein
MIEPDGKAVQAELAKLRKRLERRPDSWIQLEGIGRCLRWLGDPEARENLLRAAANYRVKEGRAGDHMRLGNLYRLAGDAPAAQRHFERARALYAPRAYREDPNPLDVEHMIPASFLVGRDDEVAELIARLRAIDRDTDLICYPIARLAEARRTRNPELASEVVSELAAMVRRYRARIWNTGGPLPWDWYELALETRRSLSEAGGE